MLLKHNTGLHPMGWHPIPSTLGQAQDYGARLVFAGAPRPPIGREILLPLLKPLLTPIASPMMK